MKLVNRNIVVGVTGGIAAYKAAELVRRLRDQGASVRVVMTTGASQFITALTLQAVSGNEVHDSLLDHRAEAGMGHIELARWADAVVIAPATAHCLARLAQGLADDLLSTLCLATEAPVTLAPSMNRVMWRNVATERNCQRLREDGVLMVGPDSGDQACGETGAGRMSEPWQIVDHLIELLSTATSDLLSERHVMITAGPTFEAIDPVRGITNHSSGKMGYAIAQAAVSSGARVTLISGPCTVATPKGVRRIDVQSALSMYDAVHQHIADVDIFIAVAAVADYRPVEIAQQKIKKNDESMTLELTRNPDILASVATLDNRPFTVGFAAETNDIEAHARKKLMAKKIDLICANHVGGSDGGFGSDENALTLIDHFNSEHLPMGDKRRLAQQLIDSIAERLHAKHSTQNPGQSAG